MGASSLHCNTVTDKQKKKHPTHKMKINICIGCQAERRQLMLVSRSAVTNGFSDETTVTPSYIGKNYSGTIYHTVEQNYRNNGPPAGHKRGPISLTTLPYSRKKSYAVSGYANDGGGAGGSNGGGFGNSGGSEVGRKKRMLAGNMLSVQTPPPPPQRHKPPQQPLLANVIEANTSYKTMVPVDMATGSSFNVGQGGNNSLSYHICGFGAPMPSPPQPQQPPPHRLQQPLLSSSSLSSFSSSASSSSSSSPSASHGNSKHNPGHIGGVVSVCNITEYNPILSHLPITKSTTTMSETSESKVVLLTTTNAAAATTTNAAAARNTQFGGPMQMCSANAVAIKDFGPGPSISPSYRGITDVCRICPDWTVCNNQAHLRQQSTISVYIDGGNGIVRAAAAAAALSSSSSAAASAIALGPGTAVPMPSGMKNYYYDETPYIWFSKYILRYGWNFIYMSFELNITNFDTTNIGQPKEQMLAASVDYVPYSNWDSSIFAFNLHEYNIELDNRYEKLFYRTFTSLNPQILLPIECHHINGTYIPTDEFKRLFSNLTFSQSGINGFEQHTVSSVFSEIVFTFDCSPNILEYNLYYCFKNRPISKATVAHRIPRCNLSSFTVRANEDELLPSPESECCQHCIVYVNHSTSCLENENKLHYRFVVCRIISNAFP